MSATSKLGVRAALRKKNILLTGFTGFLGKVLVALLLDRVPQIGRITILARGKKGLTPADRVRRMFERSPAFRPLRERHGRELASLLDAHIDVVDGDAREPLLGIDERVLASLAPQLDAVVHVAGLTDFAPDPRDGVAVNTRGALHAADVAARTRGRRLLHTSTCFVAGSVSGHVPETLTPGRSPNGTLFDPKAEVVAMESLCAAIDDRIADHAEARRARVESGTHRALALGWPNLYTYSKGLAEHLLAMRRDVVTTIVRPSIVECARELPFAGWNEGVNTSGPLVWLIGTAHRQLPFRAKNRLDVIPVDDVARGTTIALARLIEGTAEPVYQLATSDHNPLTLERAVDLTSLARRREYGKSEDPFERFVLRHLDSVIRERSPEDEVFLPTARKVTRGLRDALIAFDPEIHLPRSARERWGARLAKAAQRAGKELGKASRTLGQVDELLRMYEPFVYANDYELATTRIRAAGAMLDDEERELFAMTTEQLDWRQYWMEVQLPGLDRWSLPLLRGERVADDEPMPLGDCIRALESTLGAANDTSLADARDLGEDAE